MKASGISIYVDSLADSIARVFETKPWKAYSRYRGDISITTGSFPTSACETDL
jgi:hypothetical protein